MSGRFVAAIRMMLGARGSGDAGLAFAAHSFRRRGGGRRLNGMRDLVGSKQLLERDEQLARIEAAFADARTGRGRFVVVEGPAGIGKTALLAAARTAAAEGGMRVLRSRATAMETNFAFGVVRQLFEPPLAEASELERADLLQAAAGVAAGTLGLAGARPIEGRSTPGVDPSFAILHGLYWLCANLAAGGPLCVVVDDAHWADTASLRYLAFLLTRLEELDLALVVATRPPEAAPEAELLATVITDPSADVIRLQPLTGAAVVQLLERELGRAPDPGVVDTCLRVTRGTPFLVRELVTALSQGGSGTGVETVGRSVHLRLRLSDHAGRLARALAILEQSDLLPAARLAGLEELEAADAADLLANGGILEPGRPLTFVHPLVRDGIYSELPSPQRTQGHRRAAELLAEQPGAKARVAEHLLMSEPTEDPWVVERLVAAARAAAEEGAPESQALFLRRALAESPAPGDRPALLLALGIAEASAGLPNWHEHLQQAVDAAPDPAAAAEAALVLADALSGAQRYPEAVEALDRAATTLGAPRSELGLQLEAAAVIAEFNDPANMPPVSARRVTLRELAAGESAAPPELLSAAAFISVLMNEPAEYAAELASRALQAADSPAHGSGRRWVPSTSWFGPAAYTLLWTERYAQLRPLLDVSIAQARATGDSARLGMGLAIRSWLALRLGDLRGAEADARMALAATELPAPPMFRVLNGAVLVQALVEQDELDAAEQALAPLDFEADSGSLISPPLRFARGQLRIAQGRVAEGLEEMLGVGALLTRSLVTSPGALPWRSQAALIHLALGDGEAAERLAKEEVELARSFGAPRALGVALRGAGVVAGGDRGVSLLREAIDVLERGEPGLEKARALADLGAMFRRRNRRTEARELLREALDAAHRAGARRLAEYAETELRATGARPRRVVLSGLDSLTASERRVAEFASQGLSNREIAQTLFVTARTVEGHLTSVFRKLQIDSRDALPAELAGAAVPA
jgi:DNA-binding CsgD family transcriptional regulator/tetratricopeptide (TPR) repeat protein